jgi:hypothetical protein
MLGAVFKIWGNREREHLFFNPTNGRRLYTISIFLSDIFLSGVDLRSDRKMSDRKMLKNLVYERLRDLCTASCRWWDFDRHLKTSPSRNEAQELCGSREFEIDELI